MGFWYNLHDILSYNAFINIVNAERGVGKSYSAKCFVANKFIKTGEQFLYLRRYKTELKEAMTKDGKPIFFEQIKDNEQFKDIDFKNTGRTMSINNKICGYGATLTTALTLKGATFEKVTTIIFDEYLTDNKSCYRYLKHEVETFLDIIETVGRMRDNLRIIMLGNSISISNPYFEYFNLHIPYNTDIQTFKNGLIALQQVENIEYRKAKKETKFGKLIDGTLYGDYAINNQFLQDNNKFIEKRPNKAIFLFTIITDNINIGLWKENNNFYCSKDYDPNCKTIYSLSETIHDKGVFLITSKTNTLIKILVAAYNSGRLFFESQRIKNTILSGIR